MRVSDNKLNAYAERIGQCNGWDNAPSQSATYRHQTKSGARVAIEVIPGQFDYSISDEFHLEQMAIQEGQIADSMLAMENGEYVYMTEVEDAAWKIPIVEDDIVIGWAKGKYSGASNDRSCSKFRDSVGHDVVTNRFVCTFKMENNFYLCLKKYLKTVGEKWVRQNSRRSPNGVIYPMDGEQAIRMGEQLTNRMIAQLMLNNQEQLARNINGGCVFSGDKRLTILEGTLKQLYYVGKIGQSKETIQCTLQRMTDEMAVEITMGAQMYRVPFNTDVSTTVGDVVSKINNIKLNGKFPMQATRVVEGDSIADASFIIISTDSSSALPINPLKVVWKTPSNMYPNAEVKTEVLVSFDKVDKSVVLPYVANQSELDEVKTLLDNWKKYVRYNETFQEVVGDVWIHVSRTLATKWEEGFAMLQPSAAGMGQTDKDRERAKTLSERSILNALATKLGVRGIHIDPYMEGDLWYGTPKSNLIFGINTGMDDNYIKTKIGGVGAQTKCPTTGDMKSLEDHLVVDSAGRYGVGFRRYSHVVHNLCSEGCDELPMVFKPLDPEAFGRNPIETNVIVQAAA